MTLIANRKKVNFMVDVKVLAEIERLIPAGQRSNFVNESLDEALLRYSRGVAIEGMRKLAKKLKVKVSDSEIRKLKNYGRE